MRLNVLITILNIKELQKLYDRYVQNNGDYQKILDLYEENFTRASIQIQIKLIR